MHPVLLPPLFTFCASVVLAAYVLARRHKDSFHWALSGFLVGLVLWTGGVLARLVSADEAQLAVSVKVIFVGVMLSSSFWPLMALAYVELRGSGRHPHAKVSILALAALFAMALFTNDGHRLFLRRVDFAALAAGPSAYVGPVFWVFIVWAYGCVGYGMALYLRAARRMLRRESRRRGGMLALASFFPVAASTIYVFQLVPVRYDLTPMGLFAAIILLAVAVFRYQLFESIPLAREAVLAHLGDGVVMATASGRITSWNPAAAGIFARSGIRAREPLADAIARLLPGYQADSEGVSRTAAPGRPTALRTDDGRLIELTTASVDTGHGDAAGQFAILSDRSDVDRVEQLARHTQRLEIVGVLAAEVAHEINDPLTFVRSNLIELERLGAIAGEAWTGADAKLAEELEDLRAVAIETLEGVERIRRIVEGMRELSSVERGGFAELDLADVVQDALRLARLEDDPTAPRVERVLRPVPPVLGNADRLVQVVLNLLVNARQSLTGVADPWIRIETTVRGDFAELRVRDNGPGVPEDLRHRIFDPFFTTRGPDEGTGLGLAIAFDIALEHDGVIEECSGSDPGACFALRIPAADRPSGDHRSLRISGSPT